MWAGYAFEAVIYKHIDYVLSVLHIKSAESISSWRFVAKTDHTKGTQIDLLIDRSDQMITLCEIKHTEKPFVIDKSYAENLKRKISLFIEKTKTDKQVHLVMISSHGLQTNAYSRALIEQVVTCQDLL